MKLSDITLRQYAAGVIGLVVVAAIILGMFFFVKFLVHEATKERPHFNTGTIIQREYNPAHYDDWTEHRWIGQICSGSGTSRTCIDQYMWVQHHDYVPDDYDIRIENCEVHRKDGTVWVDKHGNAKCFHKWIDVDVTVYHNPNTAMGKIWNG